MTESTREEYGAPQPQAKAIMPDGQPRGDAMFPVPHQSTFIARPWNGQTKNYWYQFDEAVSHSRENAERMRLDPVIDACLRLRVYPTALLTSHIDPDDDTDATEVECAARAERVLARMPGYLYAKRWLLDDGLFKGRSGCWMRWQFVNKHGRNWHVPTRFDQIDGDKLVFKTDGRVGILVDGGFSGPTEPTERGPAYFCNSEDREQLLVHSVEPEDRSYYKWRQAGAIHGTGLRGRLYWLWALKARVWAMGMDFLEWFARGVTIFNFEHGNEEHFKSVKAWVESQFGQSVMLFPRLRDGGPGYKPVERLEVPTASPAFIQKLLTEYFDDLIKLCILGQTLTSSTAPTGLGSGVASAHQTTFDNFVKYDAMGIDETETRDLIGPFYRSNFPGIPQGRRVSEVDDPNVQQLMDASQVIYGMGGGIPEEPLLEAAGLPEVKPGDTILTNVQPMQPAAVGAMPENTPVVQGSSPIRMSLRDWATCVTQARRGNRQAQKLFRTRRVSVTGLPDSYTNRAITGR